MNTTAHRARPHRTSEGTASAQVINAMPRPYLLDTSTLQDDRAVVVAGNPEQRPVARAHKPLRLIKPATANALHADMPKTTRTKVDQQARRITWMFLVAWCLGWLAVAAWAAFH